MTANELWDTFKGRFPEAQDDYTVWAFGGAPDELAELVIQGIKTGTASAYPLYELEGEPLPKAGDYSVILDSKGNAVCVIQTTAVTVVPFARVPAAHAFQEGEGDRSLEYWRSVHAAFFTSELAAYGLAFDPDMKVVCEEFKLLYTPE